MFPERAVELDQVGLTALNPLYAQCQQRRLFGRAGINDVLWFNST